MVYAGIILVFFYLVILVAVYIKQDSMLYFPEKEIWQTPKDISLEYEEIFFTTKDEIIISGWYIPAENEKGVLIFCHGNAGNISHRLDSIKNFNKLGLSVLIFDYRGYGKSDGKPSERGTYLDAAAAWEYLINVKHKSPENIILFGRSLGAAIAAETALRNNPAGLIIESAFTSVPDMGKKFYPWLPVKLISKFKYSTVDKINLIKCPKLIIHSSQDEVIPFEHGKLLFESASKPKDFLEIKGDHNEGFLLSGNIYINGLRKFLDECLNP
jgi:fermentation-respiration switch protein FrsA (DUF1100 family)